MDYELTIDDNGVERREVIRRDTPVTGTLKTSGALRKAEARMNYLRSFPDVFGVTLRDSAGRVLDSWERP